MRVPSEFPKKLSLRRQIAALFVELGPNLATTDGKIGRIATATPAADQQEERRTHETAGMKT